MAADIDLDAIREQLRNAGYVAQFWSVGDVHKERPGLTDEQAMDVLQRVEWEYSRIDGITYDTIARHALAMFPEPEDATPDEVIAQMQAHALEQEQEQAAPAAPETARTLLPPEEEWTVF